MNLKSKITVPFIAKVIPIIIFYIFFAYSDKMLKMSITPLGRFIAICLILFYTSIHTLYGIIMALLVIVYYQMDFVEGFANDCDTVNSQSLRSNPSLTLQTSEASLNQQFKMENCKANGQLVYKEYPVKLENIEHIFPDLQFTYGKCNPCDVNCAFTISQKLSTQEEMTFPKSSDDWVTNIWQTWFSEDSMKPYAASGIITEQFSLI